MSEAMKEKANQGFLDFFSDLEDPRVERCKLHPLGEILLLTVCGVIAGCEGWDDLEDFGESKLEFLRQYLPYEHGIPSGDTLRRFFRAIDPKEFQSRFIEWVKSLQESVLPGRVIAFDGKTSRHSFDGEKAALHLVSAFASEARLVLGQQKVSEKSNEITAIPELLKWLDVRGAIVTIDAMGCQKHIAEQIVNQGGDYVLGLKGNQGNLHDDVKIFFESEIKLKGIEQRLYEALDKGHGRIEKRVCIATDNIDWLKERHSGWSTLKSIICIKSERKVGQETTSENRYYVSSLSAEPEKLLHAIRQHWGIENSLHWVLDMSFGDDQSRIRKDHAPNNLAVIRHCALNMIQQIKTKRQTIKRLRKMAGWDDSVLKSILDQHL